MKVLAGAALAALLTVGLLTAEVPRSQIYSRPSPPPREVLDRLNLKMAWRAYIPVGERRDGLATVQLTGNDLFVQTRSGLIVALDAETGVTRWRVRVGKAYEVPRALAINRRGVYVVNATFLYALNRASGAVEWQYRLPGGLSAAPVADDQLLFLPLPNGRLQAYYLPRAETAVVASALAQDRPGQLEPGSAAAVGARRATDLGRGPLRSSVGFGTGSVREAGLPEELGVQPIKVWDFVSGLRLELPPLLSHEYVLAVSPAGTAVAVPKVPQENRPIAEVYRFAAQGGLDAPPGQFLNTAYIGSHDFNVYALDISTGRLDWRYTAGAAVARRPVALAQDVYVTAQGLGMTRLDRATGEALWRVPRGNRVLESNPEADRFLAANPKFVYAMDASGRLLVLDRQRGHKLSGYDTHTFYAPVTNEVTDRVYLAANDGLIVCLHDKEYTTPYRQRRAEEEAAEPTLTLLAQPVSDPGSKPTALRDMVDALRQKYKVQIIISERAFRDAGRDPVAGKLVTFPKVNKVPLGEALRTMLAPVNATYEVISDTILIIPAALPKAPPPREAGPPR